MNSAASSDLSQAPLAGSKDGVFVEHSAMVGSVVSEEKEVLCEMSSYVQVAWKERWLLSVSNGVRASSAVLIYTAKRRLSFCTTSSSVSAYYVSRLLSLGVILLLAALRFTVRRWVLSPRQRLPNECLSLRWSPTRASCFFVATVESVARSTCGLWLAGTHVT